jgi:hypothetical protein
VIATAIIVIAGVTLVIASAIILIAGMTIVIAPAITFTQAVRPLLNPTSQRRDVCRRWRRCVEARA